VFFFLTLTHIYMLNPIKMSYSLYNTKLASNTSGREKAGNT